jgi:transcriptional regulator with XRE-family HTH domain
MRFSEYLREIRLGAKLTQDELARRCRLSNAYVNQLETAKAAPPTRKVCKILARALGISENELWKHAFAARLEKWLRKEGFGRISAESISEFYEELAGGSKRPLN